MKNEERRHGWAKFKGVSSEIQTSEDMEIGYGQI